MHFHQNHCWCSQSHWDGETFDCRYLVIIEQVSMVDYNGPEEDDFNNLLHENQVMIERDLLGKMVEVPRNILTLNREVYDWLENNVEDMKGHDYGDGDRKGWCIGDDDYRENDHLSLTVFFRRRRDAMKFIKTWSTHKKPTTYLNYFKDDRRRLVDGKLVEWGHEAVEEIESEIEFEE